MLHHQLDKFVFARSPYSIANEFSMLMLDSSGQFSLSGRTDLLMQNEAKIYFGDNKPGNNYGLISTSNTENSITNHMLNYIFQIIAYGVMFRDEALLTNGYNPAYLEQIGFFYNKDAIMYFNIDAVLSAIYEFYTYLILKFRRSSVDISNIDEDDIKTELKKLPWFKFMPIDEKEIFRLIDIIIQKYPKI